jgi:anti-anti-sigma factor
MDVNATITEIVERGGSVAVFELLGEHDMAGELELRAALNEAVGDGRGIVVDLSRVEVIDSSVIATLLDIQRSLAAQGRELATEVNTASVVMRALESTEFCAAVATVGTREAAVAIAGARGAPAAQSRAASGDRSFVAGGQDNVASAWNAFASGWMATASGTNSFVGGGAASPLPTTPPA